MVREPVVAGSFYPGEESELRRQLSSLIRSDLPAEKALGAVSPHAGYMYSGSVAGELFARIELPDTVVILAPNHTGLGAAFSAWSDDWRTPLGEVATDHVLLDALHSEFPRLADDRLAHTHEHSAEVQLPFIQYVNPQAKVVGIVLMSSYLDDLKQLGGAIAEAIRKAEVNALVLASSDMTHYEAQEAAEAKDKQAIDLILALDPDAVWNVVRSKHITMCGIGPVVAMLVGCKRLGASTARLVCYRTSGHVTGDYSQVVGYAAVMVK